MIAAAIPENEDRRLRALHQSDLMDTDYEEDFNEIVQLASQICKVPISLISLVAENKEWYKAKFGLNNTHAVRNVSFCSHAILNASFFEIQDARSDPRFIGHPLVTQEPFVRYYGGIPLITSEGYTLGTLCVIDLVPRKMLDEELYALNVLAKQVMKLIDIKMLNRRLQKSVKVQNRTVAVIAHDIKNPLSAIKCAYELRQANTMSPEEAVLIDTMIPQQLGSTLSLLDNMIEWGNMQLKNDNTGVYTTNLAEICETCFEVLQLSANEKGNSMVNNIPQKLTVPYPPESIAFMLRNLLMNACKFTSDGAINVTAMREGGQITITVSDTGIGMSEKQLNKIADTKCGTNTAGTNKEKGSGLGLMLIYEFLSEVKGELNIISEEGCGTDCIITLPG